jgi:hypothetical protein
LVVLVTPEVNSVMLLTREPAVFWTPRANEAANSAPGRWGREIPPPRPVEIGTLGAETVEGRYDPHQ